MKSENKNKSQHKERKKGFGVAGGGGGGGGGDGGGGRSLNQKFLTLFTRSQLDFFLFILFFLVIKIGRYMIKSEII